MYMSPEMLEQSRLMKEQQDSLRAQWHAAGAEHLPLGLGWTTWLEPYTVHLVSLTILLAGFLLFWQLQKHVLKWTARNNRSEHFFGASIAALVTIFSVTAFLPTQMVQVALAGLCFSASVIVLLTWRKTSQRSRSAVLVSVCGLLALWGAQYIGLQALSHEKLAQADGLASSPASPLKR